MTGPAAPSVPLNASPARVANAELSAGSEVIECLLAERTATGRNERLEQWLGDARQRLGRLATTGSPRIRRDAGRLLRACETAERLFHVLAGE